MKTHWDVIVVGAGPAGLSSASAIAEQGLEVLVLDEQASPGGQIYKNIEHQSEKIINLLGDDYKHGFTVVERFRKSGARYLPGSTVWKLSHEGNVFFSRAGKSSELKAKRIVIATGAMERPQPFTGWTLPGVMGAGAVDALFKADGVIPSGPVTMVGSGPIMLLVAGHMKKLGVEVTHFFDTTPQNSIVSALPHLPKALSRIGYLMKGTGMLAGTVRSVGKYQRNSKKFSAYGKDRVEQLTVETGSKTITVQTGTVLVHEGIIPRTEFSRQLRLEHSWDPVQRYWYPTVNRDGRTSSPAIFMSGDGAFVHGAVASELKGEIAGLTIAEDLGKVSEAIRVRKTSLENELSHELSPRPFIDAMYPAPRDMATIDDDVTVCRCEEVKAGTIRELISANQTTPEMLKATSRVGMGPCQGRMCSCSLSEIVALETEQDITRVGTHNIRPPVRNIGLGELANMAFLPANQSDKEES
ncbi:FAD-dependent oxidoreductase [Desulforhopalus sp. 52FAK]